MSELSDNLGIPRLTESDFYEAELEMLTEDDRIAILELQKTNPVLAKELLIAANFETTISEKRDSIDEALRSHRKIIKALFIAMKRKREQPETSGLGGEG